MASGIGGSVAGTAAELARLLGEKKKVQRRMVSLEDQIRELDRAISRLDDVRDDFGDTINDLAAFLGDSLSMRLSMVEEMNYKANAAQTFCGNQRERLFGGRGKRILEDADSAYDRQMKKALDGLKALRSEKVMELRQQKGNFAFISGLINGL